MRIILLIGGRARSSCDHGVRIRSHAHDSHAPSSRGALSREMCAWRRAGRCSGVNHCFCALRPQHEARRRPPWYLAGANRAARDCKLCGGAVADRAKPYPPRFPNFIPRRRSRRHDDPRAVAPGAELFLPLRRTSPDRRRHGARAQPISRAGVRRHRLWLAVRRGAVFGRPNRAEVLLLRKRHGDARGRRLPGRPRAANCQPATRRALRPASLCAALPRRRGWARWLAAGAGSTTLR